MPYTISWEIPDEILRLSLQEDISKADMHALNADLQNFLDDSTLSLIIACSAVDNLEFKPIEISEALTFLKNPGLDWVLVCGAKSYLHLVTKVIFQLAQVRVRFFNTVEEAMFFWEDVSPKLLVSQ